MPGADTLTGGIALGVDIVDTERLHRSVDRWGDAFLDRLFSATERDALTGTHGMRWDSLAGRFAAKEAVRKVFGVRGEMPRWRDIEIGAGEHGEPFVNLLGAGAELARRHGVHRLLLTIAHERRTAVAVVLAL